MHSTIHTWTIGLIELNIDTRLVIDTPKVVHYKKVDTYHIIVSLIGIWQTPVDDRCDAHPNTRTRAASTSLLNDSVPH